MHIPLFSRLQRKAGHLLSPPQRAQFIVSHRDKMVGGLEQLLSSATSMIGLVILSRMMDVHSFGIVATASGIWLTVEMLQNASAIKPFILMCPDPRSDRESFGAWILWNLSVAGAFCAAFVLGSLLVWPHLPDFAYGLFLAGPLCFAGVLYMFMRRLQYHQANRRGLLLQTGLYSVGYLGITGAFWLQGIAPTPAEGALIQTTAFALPVLVLSVSVFRHARFRLGAMGNVWRARRLIGELGTAGLIWDLPNSTTLLALSILAGPVPVAVFTVTRTLVRPITLVMATISDVELSRASRAFAKEGVAGLAKVLRRARGSLWFLTVVPVLLLLLFPGFFLSLVYGDQYAGATLELRLRVLLSLPLILAASMDMGLAILRDTRFVLRIYLVSLLACLGWLAVAYLNGRLDAASALAGLVFARVIILPLVYWRYCEKMRPAPAGRAGLREAAQHG